MKVYKNLIPKSLIDQVNSIIDRYDYSESLYLFDNEKSIPHNLIKIELAKISLFQPYISDAHIVIRCVKRDDQKITHYPHFDNYLHTFVIPTLIPNTPPLGDLVYVENARKFPKNIYTNIITKFSFQNPLVKKFILNDLRGRFSSISINPGDVGYFNGLTTLHYNNPVFSERRSILIHCDNPFKDSKINKIVEYLGKLNVK